MNARSDSIAPASRAVEALVELDEHGRTLCPSDVDPYRSADDVLHDLARAAELLGSAAQRVIGEKSAAIERHAHALAAALAARGNLQHLHRHP
ncbi:hypothetical protein PHK61_08420 [Actinomycetospora lutea]|uniref:hypothetical protein n=1 Tax=Actinomycetospora lutea TaxID=663604 RepID=UPI0023663792|nr:hypothetical protein [Actinomycetospora lutea]MDD7938440.1 hypothetical protein [Actinomycetospora lutea]